METPAWLGNARIGVPTDDRLDVDLIGPKSPQPVDSHLRKFKKRRVGRQRHYLGGEDTANHTLEALDNPVLVPRHPSRLSVSLAPSFESSSARGD